MARAFPLLTIDPSGSVGENGPLFLHIRLAEMLIFARHVHDVERVAELHNMRIAAKRLRYTMELFLPYTEGADNKELASLLDKTKKIQELIGEIHDRDVRVPLLSEFLQAHEHRRPEIRVGLAKLIEQETEERKRIYDQFLAYWTEQKEGYVQRLMLLIGTLGLPPLEETTSSPSNGSAAPATTKRKRTKAETKTTVEERPASISADSGDQ